jgi:hypothetical protein
LGIAAAAGLGLILGLVVMWLWNWLMPGIFNLPEINYWQAVGIFILCHLLFKSHTGHGKDDRRMPRPARDVRSRLRGHFHHRWEERADEPPAAGGAEAEV